MKIEASVDVGQNITSLLERLAQQLGTTADKVFPWYVQQAHLEGLMFISMLAAALILCVSALAYGSFRAQWRYGNPENLAAIITIAGAAGLVVALFAAFMELPNATTKMLNPNYHAMKMITRDIGKLTGKSG